MALTDSERFAAYADQFGSVYNNVQDQRTQLAQYSILRATTYLQQGNQNDQAIREFKRALAYDPQNSTAHTNLGQIYLSQNKTDDAIKEFKSVVQSSKTSVSALTNLGNAYLQAKKYTDAETQFKKAAKLDPTQPLADYTLGILYTQTDRYAEAEAQFNKVAKVSPRDGNVFYALGTLYNKMGRSEDAVKQLQKALTLKQKFPAANFELGSAYAKLGDTDNANAQLKILQTAHSSQASDLSKILNTPKMSFINSSDNKSFNQMLGARTPLWMLDPTLLTTPNASQKVTVAIQFNNEMDAASIMNPANWEISRASSAQAGYYNSSMPSTNQEVSIAKRPYSVTYDPTKQQASITFNVQQNADGNATIDPSHLVFKFTGKDVDGTQMDTAGDEIDGYAGKAF